MLLSALESPILREQNTTGALQEKIRRRPLTCQPTQNATNVVMQHRAILEYKSSTYLNSGRSLPNNKAQSAKVTSDKPQVHTNHEERIRYLSSLVEKKLNGKFCTTGMHFNPTFPKASIKPKESRKEVAQRLSNSLIIKTNFLKSKESSLPSKRELLKQKIKIDVKQFFPNSDQDKGGAKLTNEGQFNQETKTSSDKILIVQDQHKKYSQSSPQTPSTNLSRFMQAVSRKIRAEDEFTSLVSKQLQESYVQQHVVIGRFNQQLRKITNHYNTANQNLGNQPELSPLHNLSAHSSPKYKFILQRMLAKSQSNSSIKQLVSADTNKHKLSRNSSHKAFQESNYYLSKPQQNKQHLNFEAAAQGLLSQDNQQSKPIVENVQPINFNGLHALQVQQEHLSKQSSLVRKFSQIQLLQSQSQSNTSLISEIKKAEIERRRESVTKTIARVNTVKQILLYSSNSTQLEAQKRHDEDQQQLLKVMINYWSRRTENHKVKRKREAIEKKNRKMNGLNYARITEALLQFLFHLCRVGMSPKDLCENTTGRKIFPKNPVEREGSFLFLKLAKKGDYDGVREGLSANRFYVYEFDYKHRTALHYCAQHNYVHMARLLLYFSADPDARDLTAKTPLYYALKLGHFEIAKMLLEHFADPWTPPNSLQSYAQMLEGHQNLLQLLSDAKKLSLIVILAPKGISMPLIQKRHAQREDSLLGNFYMNSGRDSLSP